MVAQTCTLPNIAVPVTLVMNIGEIRNRGVEFPTQRNDVLVRDLDIYGSVKVVDSTILSNDGFPRSIGSTSRGKHAP